MTEFTPSSPVDSPAPSQPGLRPPRSRRGRRLLVATLVLALLVAVLALWLPGFAKSRLEATLSQQLLRPVSIATLSLHPLDLAVRLQGVRVEARAQSPAPANAKAPQALSKPAAAEPLLSIASLYLDLSPQSIWQRAPIVSAVQVNQPVLRLSRDAHGRLNVADIIEHWSSQPSSGKTYFSVNNVQLDGGRVEFTDHLQRSPHTQVVSDIRLGLPFIANFDSAVDTWVEPHFSAKVNGAALALDGKARPFGPHQEATLELKLDDFNLAELGTYAGLPADLHLSAARLDSRIKLAFKRGSNQANALKLTGDVTLRGIALENRAAQAWNARGERIEIRIEDFDPLLQRPIKAALKSGRMQLTRKGEKEAVTAFRQAAVTSVSVDLAHRKLAIGTITLDQAQLAAVRDSQGRIDLAALAPAPGKPEPAPARQSKPAQPWSVALAGVKLADARLRYTDQMLAPSAPLLLTGVQASTGPIDVAGSNPLQLDLDATLETGGRIKAAGTLAPAPLALDLAVQANDVDIAALQAWAGNRFNAKLTRASAGFNGRLKAAGTPLNVTLAGQAQLANLSLVEQSAGTEVLRFKKLDVNALSVATEPFKFDADTVALTDFYSRLAISPQGRLTIRDIWSKDTPPAASPPPAPAAADKPARAGATTTAAPAPAREAPLPFRIRQVLLQGGSVNFTDNFIKPNYRANLTGLTGRIGPLEAGKLGQVELRGAIDQSAPLQITGTVDPFGKELYVDIAAKARGIDLPRLSPYSTKYVGYAIEKGKLSVDVHYYVEKGQLRADNRLVLDQLVFGEKLSGTPAMSVPVHLAVAILKNAEGEINLDLPVSGSLNDPQFSIGGVLAKAFGNLLLKAVTSPFALLGSLFHHDGGELSQLEFAPGRARLTPDTEKRLDALAKALAERPALELDVIGVASPDEGNAYRRAGMERRVRQQKLLSLSKKEQAELGVNDVTLSAEEYPKFLEQAYKKEKIDKPRNLIGIAKSLPVAEMEQVMMAAIPAGEEELRNLADRRGRAARDWLVAHGVPVERVFLLAPKLETEGGKPPRVEFSLRK